MSNGYVLADTNSLVYAYRAGGTDLLDAHLNYAEKQSREFAITKTVLDEIEDGPLKTELGQYIADRNIPILSSPDTFQANDKASVLHRR
jgi:rRNA-processing protein FCF1